MMLFSGVTEHPYESSAGDHGMKIDNFRIRWWSQLHHVSLMIRKEPYSTLEQAQKSKRRLFLPFFLFPE